jgi:hypothetical protein
MTVNADPYAAERKKWRESVARRVWVEFGGRVIGDTNRALRVCEASGPPVYYIPPGDIDPSCLLPSDRTSFCESFYPRRMDSCYVGDDRVTPQPGFYYGGWVTPDLVGPFKGVPGSESW